MKEREWPPPIRHVLVLDILNWKSSEATFLMCNNGHISGHPDVCPTGCSFINDPDRIGLVKDVVMLRLAASSLWDGNCAPLDVPLWVEDGWLIDGHHRVATALRTNVTLLPVIEVHGIIDELRSHHRIMRRLAEEDPTMMPAHRPTMTLGLPD